MVYFGVTFGLGSPFSNVVLKIGGDNFDQVFSAVSSTTVGHCRIMEWSEAESYVSRNGSIIVESPKDASRLDLR